MPFISRIQRQSDYSTFHSSHPIVIDNGGSYFRIGRAEESEPRVIFRNIIPRPRHKINDRLSEILGIGHRFPLLPPKQPEGLICASVTKVLVDDGETDRVILAHNSGLEASQEAITEYHVLGPMINRCSWIELCPRTSCRHQLRVHCAEALGTLIVGDCRYGWFVHRRWKQMPRVDFESNTGEPYRLKRPEGLDVKRGSVLSKVSFLHKHCREMMLFYIEKFIDLNKQKFRNHGANTEHDSKPDVHRGTNAFSCEI